MGGDIYGTLLTWQASFMIGINIRATLSLALYFGCALMRRQSAMLSWTAPLLHWVGAF
jgi:hypothetical protein